MEIKEIKELDEDTAKAIDAGRFVSDNLQILTEFQVKNLKLNAVAVLETHVSIEVNFDTKHIKFIPVSEFVYDDVRKEYLQKVVCAIMGKHWTTNVERNPIKPVKSEPKRAKSTKPSRKGKSTVRKLGKSRRSKSSK